MVWVVFCLALSAAGVAAAQTSIVRSSPGYTYFNRAGATIEQHDADTHACQALMQELSYNRRTTTVQGGEAWLGAGYAVSDALNNVLVRRRTLAANFENCMVVRGWRVVRVAEAEGASLDALSAADLRAALAPLVGAEAPSGEIARAFNNDMQQADTIWTGAPGDLDKVSLSIQVANISESDEEGAQERPPQARNPPRTARPPNTLSPRAASRLPDSATLIVFRADSDFRFATTVLRFERMGADPQRAAWQEDGLPSVFEASVSSLGGGGDKTFIFQVPPGRWRLASLRQTSGMDQAVYETSFCLGAPSFEIAEGQAVFAGAFHLRTGPFGPDLALASLGDTLADAPALQARLQPAVYANGSTSSCNGTYVYAFEAPGAPFQDGYAFGSRAQPSP